MPRVPGAPLRSPAFTPPQCNASSCNTQQRREPPPGRRSSKYSQDPDSEPADAGWQIEHHQSGNIWAAQVHIPVQIQVQIQVQIGVPSPVPVQAPVEVRAGRSYGGLRSRPNGGQTGACSGSLFTPHRRMPDQEDDDGHGRVVLFFFNAPCICGQCGQTPPAAQAATLAQSPSTPQSLWQSRVGPSHIWHLHHRPIPSPANIPTTISPIASAAVSPGLSMP